MQQSLEMMQLALRVLADITKKRQPNAKDLAALRHLAGPENENTDPDVLACDVIQKAIKRRESVRSAETLGDQSRPR
jgi:hypothetical protein